jgi:DNA-binding MarR family transcriptional regulator
MIRKEFINLIEQNIIILDRMSSRLKSGAGDLSAFPRQQLQIIARLHLGGRAKLKDIARRESVPASNLCSAFRKLEKDGFVLREIDENDRRDTWYSLSKAGDKVAERAMEAFHSRVAELFAGISKDDEAELTTALKSMNKVLKSVSVSG